MNESAILPLEPEEEALEQELRSFVPNTVSSDLKERIRLVAKDLEDGDEESAVESQEEAVLEKAVILRFYPGWMSAAAALVAAAVGVAWWLSSSSMNSPAGAVAEEDSAVTLPAGDAADGPLIWDQTPAERYPNAFDAGMDPNQVLVGQQNDGVYRTPDGQAMWKVRYYLLNVKEVEDPETGEIQQKVVPEERVIMVPVSHD